MFHLGFYTIPAALTGLGLSEPDTTALPGDQTLVVQPIGGGRIKRLRAGTGIVLVGAEDQVTIEATVQDGRGVSDSALEQEDDVSLIQTMYTLKRLRPGNGLVLLDLGSVVQLGLAPVPPNLTDGTFTRWHKDYSSANNGVWRNTTDLNVNGTAVVTSGAVCHKFTNITASPTQDAWFYDNAPGAWSTFISPVTVGGTTMGNLYGLSIPTTSRCILWTQYSNIFRINDWTFIGWRTTYKGGVYLSKGYLPTMAQGYVTPSGDNAATTRAWALMSTTQIDDGIPDAEARFKMVFYGGDGSVLTWVFPDIDACRVQTTRTWFLGLHFGEYQCKVVVQGSPILTYEYPLTSDVGIVTSVPQTLFGACYNDGTKTGPLVAAPLLFVMVHRGLLTDATVTTIYYYLRSRQPGSLWN